jgi:hypothetical protein
MRVYVCDHLTEMKPETQTTLLSKSRTNYGSEKGYPAALWQIYTKMEALSAHGQKIDRIPQF